MEKMKNYLKLLMGNNPVCGWGVNFERWRISKYIFNFNYLFDLLLNLENTERTFLIFVRR